MKVADLELACAGRDGWQTAPEAVEAMTCDIASWIPELSREGDDLSEMGYTDEPVDDEDED